MIYCSFCCIYVWLDPGTYMIARFMSFYKPGVTGTDPNAPKLYETKQNMSLGSNGVDRCNTRFIKGIKGHKPSSHIRARIKSHVYTTEWTVYQSTYHVKRYNKASTNVIYYNSDKVWYRVCGSVKHNEASRKMGTTGTSTGRRTPRSPRTPGSSGWTPSRRQELSSSRVSQEEKE